MSIKIAGLIITGDVQHFAVPSREEQVSERHFFGVNGVSQITGAPGGRTFTVPMTVYSTGNQFSTFKKLSDFFDNEVNAIIGKVGLLEILDTAKTFKECRLSSFSIRANPGIVLDEAGLLGGKYFCEVDFTFRQL